MTVGDQDVAKVSDAGVRRTLMKNGKTVGPDEIPVEVWKCLGEVTVEF